MKVDLTELLRTNGYTLTLQESESISYPEDGLCFSKPVDLDLVFTNADQLVILQGEVVTETELICSRCGEVFYLPLHVKLNEEFAKEDPLSASAGKRGQIELHEEDFISPLGKDNIVDVSDVVRQNLLLALPIKPLCPLDNGSPKGS